MSQAKSWGMSLVVSSLLGLFLLAGCGDDPKPGSPDTGVEMDASTVTDGSTPMDAGMDASEETDSGTTDAGEEVDGALVTDGGPGGTDAGPVACDDEVQNGDETDVDCGGETCDPCDDLLRCSAHTDCASNVCIARRCRAVACNDGLLNGDETDRDCGGPECPGRRGGRMCTENTDCRDMVCEEGTCLSCDDGVMNAEETDVDCGGSVCDPCGDSAMCVADTDCDSEHCVDNTCVSCTDGIMNLDETDVDCGGAECDGCRAEAMCEMDRDCAGIVCVRGTIDTPERICPSTCLDNVCISCDDGVQNGEETDVDCGGPNCLGCKPKQACIVAGDCESGLCHEGQCLALGCDDGAKRSTETDVDCGGPGCLPCESGLMCLLGRDCESLACSDEMVCTEPSCDDGVRNGTETDVDCGGPPADGCPRCPEYRRCERDRDCTDGTCTDGDPIDFCGTGSCTPFGVDGFGYVGCTERPTELPCPDITESGTGISLTDDGEATVELGFDFDFYGTVYSEVTIAANGAILFGTTDLTGFNSCPLPYTPFSGGDVAMLAAYWDDLDPEEEGGMVHHETLGEEGSRTFVVNWNVQHYPSSPELVEFTVVLEEATGSIQVCYGETSFGNVSYDNGRSATAGIQGGEEQSLMFGCNEVNLLSDGLLMRYLHP